MGTSVIPVLIDALVTQCKATLGKDVDVLDGFGVSNNVGGSLMIGVDDPHSQTSASSGDAGQKMATAGTPRSRDQDVRITCAALAWDGDSVQKAARDAAYAMQAVVENLLRADPQLGTGLRFSQPMELGNERLSQNTYEDGCDALLIFTVTATARI